MILFKIIKYQLYLLQLENYELGRYLNLLAKKGLLPKDNQRKDLVWTNKALLIFAMALVIYLALIILAALVTKNVYVAVAVALVLYFFCFLCYFFATVLIWPLDYLAKKRVVAKATSLISSHAGNLKIIGIAGSYGKTTMKQILLDVLGTKFNVAATPESVNTPVGIARWILNNFDSSLEVLVIEMGEHYKGDIKEIGQIVKLDVAVITGINESHLERMKSLDNIVSTIFEVVGCTKPQGQVVINADDRWVMKNSPVFIGPNKKKEEFSIDDFHQAKFNAEKLVWIGSNDFLGEVQLHILGQYILGAASAATKIGKSLGMTAAEIKSGIEKIKPINHRLEPINGQGGVLIIDDAYNGNPAGVREAVKVLSRFGNRRKIFITPGLVEMGDASPEIHREIGQQLSLVVDVLVLIRNSVTGYIAEGFKNESKIIWFNSAPEAHKALGTFLKPGDVVLFQNDWGDQYL